MLNGYSLGIFFAESLKYTGFSSGNMRASPADHPIRFRLFSALFDAAGRLPTKLPEMSRKRRTTDSAAVLNSPSF
jgi:hypothetical protein